MIPGVTPLQLSLEIHHGCSNFRGFAHVLSSFVSMTNSCDYCLLSTYFSLLLIELMDVFREQFLAQTTLFLVIVNC